MADLLNTCHFGDCRDSMRMLIDAGVRVQTCVTSPPYWGLRDYGHDGQLGLEETVDEYIANQVDVFRLVRDLLADDGTLWVNMGDSYAGNGGQSPQSGALFKGRKRQRENICLSLRAKGNGLKPKDMIGQPWRLAFALQADGWYLRQDIIWHKPNPMPESVRDRCTKAHEYIFLLSKSERYYFDQDAIKDAGAQRAPGNRKPIMALPGERDGDNANIRGSLHKIPPQERSNKRSVWTVATQPYAGAHFAVFPPDLIKPCILAGSRPGDVVLDPFFGSGTTGQVAESLGRQWVGCELNPAYEALQRDRVRQKGLTF